MPASLPCMRASCLCFLCRGAGSCTSMLLQFQAFVLACLQASRRCAGGIVEALYNFKLVPDG